MVSNKVLDDRGGGRGGGHLVVSLHLRNLNRLAGALLQTENVQQGQCRPGPSTDLKPLPFPTKLCSKVKAHIPAKLKMQTENVQPVQCWLGPSTDLKSLPFPAKLCPKAHIPEKLSQCNSTHSNKGLSQSTHSRKTLPV